jgi:hypothetical protein
MPDRRAPEALPPDEQGNLVGTPVSRRDLLRQAAVGASALGLSALLAACSGRDRPSSSAPASSGPAGSIGTVGSGGAQLSLLNAQSQLQVGRQLYTFGLSTPDNRLVTGGRPEVWTARDETSKATGPFPADWFTLDAYVMTGDKSPRSELTGFYAVQLDFEATGNWLVAATIDGGGGQRGVARGGVPVAADPPARVGSKALSERTLVARDKADLAKVCTRTPPCDLHGISLDRALASGRPTVVSFSTPLFCSSRMCGPVVDELLVAAGRVGQARANLLHVEIYPDQKAADKPVRAFTAWGFQSEPWTIVIDRKAIIRARFEGPVTSTQIEAALRPLLLR